MNTHNLVIYLFPECLLAEILELVANRLLARHPRRAREVLLSEAVDQRVLLSCRAQARIRFGRITAKYDDELMTIGALNIRAIDAVNQLRTPLLQGYLCRWHLSVRCTVERSRNRFLDLEAVTLAAYSTHTVPLPRALTHTSYSEFALYTVHESLLVVFR